MVCSPYLPHTFSLPSLVVFPALFGLFCSLSPYPPQSFSLPSSVFLPTLLSLSPYPPQTSSSVFLPTLLRLPPQSFSLPSSVFLPTLLRLPPQSFSLPSSVGSSFPTLLSRFLIPYPPQSVPHSLPSLVDSSFFLHALLSLILTSVFSLPSLVCSPYPPHTFFLPSSV